MQKDNEQQRHDEESLAKRQAEATSDKGLSEARRTEKTSGSKNDDQDQPSPDGQFDDKDEAEKAGPM